MTTVVFPVGDALGDALVRPRIVHFLSCAADSPNRLTEREEEIAGLVVDGYTNAEIAAVLRVSERTVDGHLENIKRKIHETRRVRVAMRLKELGYQPPQQGM